MKEDIGGKWEVLGRLVEEKKKLEALEMDKQRQPDDPLINQWMTISEPPDKEKRMMDSLKDRMRQKQEQEKIRQAELEQRQREKEKQEEYAREQKEKEEREKRQREEEKRREMEDLERKRERERDAIKFKTRESSGTARYRKRPPSPANSPQQGKIMQITKKNHNVKMSTLSTSLDIARNCLLLFCSLLWYTWLSAV